MPPLLNANARLVCAHGGQVTVLPRQSAVLAGGAPVLAAPDLVGAPSVGCAQVPTPAGTKPCTTIVSEMPGSTSPKVTAGGRPAYVATFSGLTDGVPPGVVQVVAPGQAAAQG